jgi:hypothetical protein
LAEESWIKKNVCRIIKEAQKSSQITYFSKKNKKKEWGPPPKKINGVIMMGLIRDRTGDLLQAVHLHPKQEFLFWYKFLII